MKYSELSIYEFLNEIINPSNKNGLPKIELYNYAKNKTTNFEIKPLKLMIDDVVDFANHKMHFEANKTTLSIPTNDEIEVQCLFSIEGYLHYWVERYSTKILHDSLNFTDEEKKEKIQFLRDSCKDIVSCRSVYKKLIFLVHIAEITHKLIPSVRAEWICFPINFWSVSDFSDILLDELERYNTDIKTSNDTINKCESMEDIPNIIKIYDTAIELTDSIHKVFMPYRYGRGNAGNQIVIIDDVYTLKYIHDIMIDIMERNMNNQFANYIKIDSLLEPYKNEFRRGYDEIINNCVHTSISFRDDVFSAATHLYMPFHYDPENNILPDNWGLIGYNFGRFYAAWCIVLKRQRFFEPLFMSLFSSNTANINSLSDLFLEKEWEPFVDVLCKCKPPLLIKYGDKYKFVGNDNKELGCVGQWFNFLKSKNKIKGVNRNIIAKVLSKEIDNLTIKGGAIENSTSTYEEKYEEQLKKMLNLM